MFVDLLGVVTVIKSCAWEKFQAGQYRLIHYDCNGTQQSLGMIQVFSTHTGNWINLDLIHSC